MDVQALKLEFFGLVKVTREMKQVLSDVETEFYEEIQFTEDANEIVSCEQRIFESRQLLIDSHKRMAEIRAAVTPEALKEWKTEWKTIEKAVAAATATAKDMSTQEILRQQLELLAEFSQYDGNDARDLAELTKAMLSLAEYLPNNKSLIR